ncbi:hypothetical protein C8F04DRAFT_1304752 [Mycena alexandri]|uniref:Uncharacterized protein n=1 Tax=Mycena alexandri TaxID=1745969 RepID=A0AAD6S9S9_9AGAR|nr:hypothetical protein C8F04DRAFT_1304752 [Mycena alexandri]
MHTLLPWILSTTLVGATLGLFQPQALTGDKAYELMRSGGEYTIAKLNALNDVLGEIGDNSTLIDLLKLLAASSECQQAIMIVSYHAESPVPYEERFGRLALDNIEAYNASASNVIESFVRKEPYIQKIHSCGHSKACDEIRRLTDLGRRFMRNVDSKVKDSGQMAQQISAVHSELQARMDAVVRDHCAVIEPERWLL